ncbi:MAG TPA: hypothetical protein VGU23_08775, partial [Acidobacteriaceae bacterium]|nr:hypothetical protein [Acidobacteriaceae bacterium]
IPLLIVGAVGVGGLGWFGYKANKRIAAWGRNMDEVDQIFKTANAAEEEAQAHAVRGRATEDARAKAPFVGQHLPTGPR